MYSFDFYFQAWLICMGLTTVPPLVLGIVSCLVYFWSRREVDLKWFTKYQYWKYCASSSDAVGSYVSVDVALSFILFGLGFSALGALQLHPLYLPVFVALGLSVFFVPRLLFDAQKALRISRTSGKSKRLDALEKEIRSLKGG